MSLHPKSTTDLALAPVAAAIDLNLQRLRDRKPSEIDYELALELNLNTHGSTPRRPRALGAAERDPLRRPPRLADGDHRRR